MTPELVQAHNLQMAQARARIVALEAQSADLTAILITLIVGSDQTRVFVPVKDIKSHRRYSIRVTKEMAAPPKELETDAEPEQEQVLVIDVVKPEQQPRVLTLR